MGYMLFLLTEPCKYLFWVKIFRPWCWLSWYGRDLFTVMDILVLFVLFCFDIGAVCYGDILFWFSLLVLFVYFSYHPIFVQGCLPTLAIILVWIWLYRALSNVADGVVVCFEFLQCTFCFTSKFAVERWVTLLSLS